MAKKWILYAGGILILSVSFDAKVYAAQTNTIINNIIEKEKDITANEVKLDELLSEIAIQETELLALNNEMEELRLIIDKTDKKIEETDIVIEKSKLNIKKQEEKLDSKKTLLEKSLRLMHQKGDVSFVEFLFRSESVSSFLYRFDLLKDINAQHKDIIKDMQKIVGDLEEQKRTEIREKNNLQLEILKQYQSRNMMASMVEEKEILVTTINEKYEGIKKDISQDQAVIKQMIYEMQEMSLYEGYSVEDIESQSDELTITGKDLVDIAYKWVLYRGLGSDNPVTYSMPRRQLSLSEYGDCSAFTRRVYMDAGYGHIGYTTADQIANPKGQYIEHVNDLQPGDLMYFGPTGSHVVYSYLPNGKKVATAHVAIFVGGGKMIDLASGVGTISIKDFSEGGKWEWYVKNRWVGGKRFEK